MQDLPGFSADMHMADTSSGLILLALKIASAFLIHSKHASIHTRASCCDHFVMGESSWYSEDEAAGKVSPVSTSTSTDFVLDVRCHLPSSLNKTLPYGPVATCLPIAKSGKCLSAVSSWPARRHRTGRTSIAMTACLLSNIQTQDPSG